MAVFLSFGLKLICLSKAELRCHRHFPGRTHQTNSKSSLPFTSVRAHRVDTGTAEVLQSFILSQLVWLAQSRERPMIIAEYTLDQPVLRQSLKRVPDLEIKCENSYASSYVRIQMMVLVETNDNEAFDAAVDEDPTVDGPVVLTETIDRRLYRFDLVDTGATASIMPVLTEVGGVQQSLTATNEGWLNRTQFPNREAFERVYQFCRDHEIGFKFNRIYERSELLGPSTPALTDAQLETLIEAVDSGYLDIPRKSSLDELGQRLGISESAASERFRRGVKNLIQQTVSQ